MNLKDLLKIVSAFANDININYFQIHLDNKTLDILYEPQYFKKLKRKKIIPIIFWCHASMYLLNEVLRDNNIDTIFNFKKIKDPTNNFQIVHIILEIADKIENKTFYFNHVGNIIYLTTKFEIITSTTEFETIKGSEIKMPKNWSLSENYHNLLNSEYGNGISLEEIKNKMKIKRENAGNEKERKIPQLEIKVDI